MEFFFFFFNTVFYVETTILRNLLLLVFVKKISVFKTISQLKNKKVQITSQKFLNIGKIEKKKRFSRRILSQKP